MTSVLLIYFFLQQACDLYVLHLEYFLIAKSIIIIIINNFFFVGIMQHFKILQIVFRSKKLIKVNYKPSKMIVLKDTFQQSFRLHNYWELKKKKKTRTQTHTYSHVHINAHTRILTCKHAHTHI